LSFHAAELLLANLPVAYRDGANRAAREACSYGSVIAGMALANARAGVIHGIAHPLGIRCHVPHGVCCGVLLPAALRLNRAAAREKYDRLSAAAGGDIAEVAERMNGEMGVVRRFKEYDVRRADFAVLAKESMPSGSLQANPKKITEDDVIRLLEEVTECR
jgi:alcohol dehydrogenase